MVWLGVMVGGTVGSWVGALMTHGNWFSLVSILLGGVGSIVGIFVGYKIGRDYF